MLLPFTLYGQFNDTVQHNAGLISTGTINQTDNSSSYLLNNTLKFGVKKKLYSANFLNNWIYGEQQQQQLTNNDYTSTLDFNLYKGFPRFYYWGLTNYISSYSLKVNNIYQAGAGIAYNIVDKKDEQLNISDGIVYENSDIYLKDTIRDKYSTYRNSLRIMFKWTIKKVIVFEGTSFFQNSLRSSNDYIIKSNLALNIKIEKWLSFTTAFTYNKFMRTNKETLLFTYGLTVDRYF